jgi:hypothetical protein
VALVASRRGSRVRLGSYRDHEEVERVKAVFFDAR